LEKKWGGACRCGRQGEERWVYTITKVSGKLTGAATEEQRGLAWGDGGHYKNHMRGG